MTPQVRQEPSRTPGLGGTQYNLATAWPTRRSGRISGLLANSMDPNFNAAGYLAANPDVYQYALKNGLDPTQFAAQHYATSGIQEGRTGYQAPQAGDASGIAGVPQAQTYLQGTGPLQTSLGNQGPIATSCCAGGGPISTKVTPAAARLATTAPPKLLGRSRCGDAGGDGRRGLPRNSTSSASNCSSSSPIRASGPARPPTTTPSCRSTSRPTTPITARVAAGDTEQMNLNQDGGAASRLPPRQQQAYSQNAQLAALR